MPAPPADIPILPEGLSLVDTHCHLDMEAYRDDCPIVIDRAVAHGVAGIITIGIDQTSSRAAIDLARTYKAVRATIGIHPHNAEQFDHQDLDILAALALRFRDEVVGFGEIGLDYVKRYAGPEAQRSLFIKQLGLAKELGLPVIIHDREAHEDCLRILQTEGPFDHGGVMHCFSGNLEFAGKIIDNNLHISIPGIVTFKNAGDLHRVAAQMPLDRLLVETDGPYLAPVPFRGKRNEPLYTLYTAAAIARLRDLDLAEIARQTSRNASRLFSYDFCRQQETR